MSTITLIGIDPGVVDTGAVAIHLNAERHTLQVEYERLNGNDAEAVRDFLWSQTRSNASPHAFVEAYRDRGTVFGTNTIMRKLEHDIKSLVPNVTVLDNTGVKKVISRELMELLDVWTFRIPTHHQDLRSAARIALYGAVKDERLNRVVTDVVIDRLKRGNVRGNYSEKGQAYV